MRGKIGKEKKKNPLSRRIAGSVSLYLLCYLVLLAVIFITVVLNDPKGWTNFIVEKYSDVIFLVASSFFLVIIIFFYYFFDDREMLLRPNNTILVFTLFIISFVICYLFGRYVNMDIRPFPLFAFLSLFLLTRRHALFLNFIYTFFLFIIDMYSNLYSTTELMGEVYLTLILGLVSGTLAIFFAGGVKTRGGLLGSGFFVAVPTVIVVLTLNLPSISESWIAYFAATGYRIMGCIIASILALALLPVFEWMFNRLTVFRLRELTSTNAPLLARLKDEAPGTFNHCLIVAQLCESCAAAIGENAELARAAAYYHDVGKLKQPDCFTENQSDYNMHDELTPELSADIIRSHARDGYELLKTARLPKAIADVAREHHGTMPIKYFYDKAMRISGGEADLRDFSYFGPTPQTKIAAILMIADATEAATRALKDRSPANVEKTVRSIIEERMDLGQFEECDITMKELSTIKQTLVDALSGIHHHRVEYPSIRFNRDHMAVEEKSQ